MSWPSVVDMWNPQSSSPNVVTCAVEINNVDLELS